MGSMPCAIPVRALRRKYFKDAGDKKLEVNDVLKLACAL